MATQMLLWTVVPFGRVPPGEELGGQWRVSVVVSPRLTPQAPDEQLLKAFPGWLDWPATLAGARFGLLVDGTKVPLVPLGRPESSLWSRLFTQDTPVAGFQFKDMSAVNWHSYPIRNVLGFLRRHYGQLAQETADDHPRLLPWKDATPGLEDMLSDLGTRTISQDFASGSKEFVDAGFSRFFEEKTEHAIRRSAFGDEPLYQVPLASPGAELDGDGLPGSAGTVPARALSPDWEATQPGDKDHDVMKRFRTADEYSFYQADRFYRRRPRDKHQRYPDYANLPPRPTVPEFDFHRIVASYANYPTLLRRLGLVLDFALENNEVIDTAVAAAGGHDAHGQCRLLIDWDGSPPGQDSRPSTAWLARKQRFVPRPRSQALDAGLLRLEHSGDDWNVAFKEQRGLFDIYQVDPDGSALKTVNFALTAQNLLTRSLNAKQRDGLVTYTTGDRQPPAALRSGGLGVSFHGRALSVISNAASAKLKNDALEQGNDDGVVLFAEDLQRGFRVDVAESRDQQIGEWRSVCQRTGEWRLVAQDEVLDGMPDDEGYVSGASTTSSGEDDDHYLNETLFRWQGWSLVAERPGRTLVPQTGENDQLQAEVPTDVDEVADTGNGLAVKFRAVPGTLPKLRFGQHYRLRARAVDLAGNSLALDDPGLEPLEQASDPVGYWRFEPVDPPVLVNRARLSEGESLERLVIRSNYNQDATAYLATADFLTARNAGESEDFDYNPANERHVVPPKSSQQQCEAHGLFDPFFGDWKMIKTGYEIAAREAGTLFDTPPGSDVHLVVPSSVEKVATTPNLPVELPSESNPVGDRLAGGQYVVHKQAKVETPWLPDGPADGVAIWAEPGHELPGVDASMAQEELDYEIVADPLVPSLVLRIPHGSEWPYREGFRLVLAERPQSHQEMPCEVQFADDGRPHWNADDRVLTFFVPKGHIVRLRYASYVGKAYREVFGIPHWAGADQEATMDRAALGQHWMITPFRRLTLVHAVQQPVCEPEFEKFHVNRQAGSQHAMLSCRKVRLHGPSTGKFEIVAAWNEWIDDLNDDGPRWVEVRGQLAEVRLDENHVNEFILAQAVNAHLADVPNDNGAERARGDRHDFGDTRFRLIQYRLRASTRFREYLQPWFFERPDLMTRTGPVAQGPAYQLADPADPGAPVLRDSAGSIEQYPVPASVAPDDPRVLYVVPTFRWSERPAERLPWEVTRHGNGLRVWLDRPWFSSGDGELLGVVLAPEQLDFSTWQKDPEVWSEYQAYRDLVTQWGIDPLWQSRSPNLPLKEHHFTAVVTSETVTLQELAENEQGPGSTPVRVLGHRVHWDEGRKLWFCDIEMEPGMTYMPFVRLALVRYQPNALHQARVSQVVLTDFAQTLPRRRLRIVEQQEGQWRVSLHGPNPSEGPLHSALDSEHQGVSVGPQIHDDGRNRVEIVLQEQEEGIDSDLGWKDVKVLAEHLVGAETGSTGGGAGVRPGLIGGADVVASRLDDGRTVVRRAGGRVRLPSNIDRGILRPGLRLPLDPAFWTARIELPKGHGKRRLQVREFERYYSDHTVPERISGKLYPRRVIEERLVFVEHVPLPDA